MHLKSYLNKSTEVLSAKCIKSIKSKYSLVLMHQLISSILQSQLLEVFLTTLYRVSLYSIVQWFPTCWSGPSKGSQDKSEGS